MGDQQSREEQEKQEMDSFSQQLDDGPDLTVNKMIKNLTSLCSVENKIEDNERKKSEGKRTVWSVHGADWAKSLTNVIIESVPMVGGLGAMVSNILIDIATFSQPEESTRESLRRVFAEEKASEVWDQIDECLKRCVINIKNRSEQVSDIKWIERHLSAAITKLKNSMLRDGHMSHQALKVWVNGAAFHILMLIHLVRLGGTQTCDPAEELIFTYLSDLELLFYWHKKWITGKCRMEKKYLVDEGSKKHKMGKGTYEKYLEAYYNHKYSRQKREIEKYLCNEMDNLRKLVLQMACTTMEGTLSR